MVPVDITRNMLGVSVSHASQKKTKRICFFLHFVDYIIMYICDIYIYIYLYIFIRMYIYT